MIRTTGFPKHGSHALVKACQLSGVPCSVEHLPFSTGVIPTTDKHIFIKRDPRNALLSWVRAQGQPATAGMFITYLQAFQNGISLVDSMAPYEGWLTDQNTHVVRFEDLVASEAALQAVVAFVGVPYITGAWGYLPGGTVTWTGALSDYATIWTPEVDAAWNAAGGPALLTRWGY